MHINKTKYLPCAKRKSKICVSFYNVASFLHAISNNKHPQGSLQECRLKSKDLDEPDFIALF